MISNNYREELNLNDCDIIIIPEQHLWDKPINSMPNMVEDNNDIINKIYELVSNSLNPVIIFDGDIFHRGTPNTDNAIKLYDYPATLNKMCNGRVYSVVGNHELSYRKGNIFWGIAEITSNYVKQLITTPTKIKSPLIKVIDELKVGSSLFCFGHYNMDFMGEVNDKDIDDVTLITHSSFGNDELFKIFSSRDKDLKPEVLRINNISRLGSLPLTNKLKYIYVGHLHTCLGQFNVDEVYNTYHYKTLLTYLGSLGRTSHTEYNIKCERNIPVHKIRNGKLDSVYNYAIELKHRELCVDEIKVALSHEKYDEQKEIRELRSVKTQNINLIAEIREVFEDRPNLKLIFDSSLISRMPDEICELLK